MKIAVIGCGNMATKVVELLHKNENSIQFITYTPSMTKAKKLAQLVNGKYIENLDEFKNIQIDYWLIGCKPQQVEDLAQSLGFRLKNESVVSMLAATPIAKLEDLFGTKKIIRIMPNTPIGLGEGIILVKCHESIDSFIKKNFINVLEPGNLLIETKTEDEFDELTVFSGSGPAYIFYFAQSLELKLLNMGFKKELARDLINKLFIGSSKLMENSSHSLVDLVNQVTSKGGVTIEAINEYKANNFNEISSKAIDKAIFRSKQITKELS